MAQGVGCPVRAEKALAEDELAVWHKHERATFHFELAAVSNRRARKVVRERANLLGGQNGRPERRQQIVVSGSEDGVV
jgi:hypothetical protein